MKKYPSFSGLCCVLFLIIGITSVSFALEIPVFSPLRYTVGVEGSSVFNETVRTGNVLSGEFHLIVQNGSQGENKVDLVEVYINQKRLVKLTSKKDSIDKKFKLITDSEMRIQLTGPQNSFVIVSIIAKKLTQVPLVILMSQADAQAAMTASLLKIKKKPTFSSHGFVPSGAVISQTPQAGVYVKEKTKAYITVSTGPALSYDLLPGTPDTPASSAVVSYNNYDTVSNAEIEVYPDMKIARTKLAIGFKPDATVGEINNLLTSIGGQITAMLQGVNQIIIRIPDPGNMAALDTLIAQIQSNHPIVRYVIKGYMAAPDVLPSNVDVLTYSNFLYHIDHHLDVRAHAAWNVRDLLTQDFHPPYLIVADYFGDGQPKDDFAVASSLGDFKTADLDEHGYHVLGIIAATFGGTDTIRGRATGMCPDYLPLWAVDLQYGFDDETVDNLIWNFISLLGGRTIVNTSLRVPGCNGVLIDKSCIPYMALSWIEKVRGSALYATGQTGAESLENSFIHLTSAGNIWATPGDTDAALNSEYSAARLLSGLVHPGTGIPIANLNNTLVIENRQKSPAPLEGLGCIAADSKTPGDLSAIGTSVFSLTGAGDGTGTMSGTSMATPQVAGLAAYLWALKPDLTPQGIMDILMNTADTSSCGYPSIDPRPLIDAYAAVLALDRGYSDAKIRRALLDVADFSGNPTWDRFFTEQDIEAFLGVFETANGEKKDYSRYDLNGDGKTGGSEKRPFNLDMDYPPPYYDTVSQDINFALVDFNENELTDLDILCYYAYSPLYSGSDTKRKDLLRDRCAELTEELTFPSTIESGDSGELRVRAGYIVPDGSTQWKEGISISITVTGGAAASSTGTTDVDGYFSTTIQHDGTSSNIIVTAKATDSGDREVTKTAEATISESGDVTVTLARGRSQAELWTCESVYYTCNFGSFCDETVSAYDSDNPLPLPLTIASSCPTYSESTTTLQQIEPSHLTINVSGSSTKVILPCDPPTGDCCRPIRSATRSEVQGWINKAGTYTVEISTLPASFSPPGEFQGAEVRFVKGNLEIYCYSGEYNELYPPSQCRYVGPQGEETISPGGSFTVDIDTYFPWEGWVLYIKMSASGKSNCVPSSASLLGQVFSIKRK